MKTFLKILGVALVLFLVVASIQERRMFTLSSDRDQGDDPDPERDQALEKSILEFHTLARHLYKSGGDPRFAERLPASERVSRELLADIEYLKKNGRVQEPQLVRLELLSSRQWGPERATASTKEYWVTPIRYASDGKLDGPAHSALVYVHYQFERAGPGWNIAAWNFEEPPPEEGGSHGAGGSE